MYSKIECGKRLRQLREATGKTQQEVAQETSISVDTLRKVEQGRSMASAWFIDVLSRYYNVSTDYIITGKDKIKIEISESPDSSTSEKEIIVGRIVSDLKKLVE